MNKTGLVALIVLAIASLLMIFVIMPNIDSSSPSQTAANAPASPAAPAAPGTPAAPGGAGGTMAPSTDATTPPPAAPVAPDAAAPATTGESATPGSETGNPEGADAPAAGTPAVAPRTEQTAPKGARPGAPQESAAAAPDAPAAPSFDVLRVEPDGSTVIAGRAAPNSKLEIMSGQTKLGEAKTTESGDFAAVFDQPLAPGDYQITLRATAPDGKTSASDEVATVSIPKAAGGELLAMVSKPGEASRIITAPGLAGEAAKAGPDAAAATNGEPAPANGAALPQAGTTGEQAALDPTQNAAAASAPAAQPNAAGAQISVTAVELEGDRIFVAGTARAGSTVRIYADDRFVGEAKADAAGRFIVEGQLTMSIGQHMIRADMLGPDGVKVQMRASVPFERPEGDQIAAVAPPVTGSAPDFDGGAFDAARIEASKAFSLLKGLYADGRTPSAEQVAAARSATEFALTSLSAIKAAPTVDAATRAMVEATAQSAREALGILAPLPRDVAAVGAAIGRLEAALQPILRPAQGNPAVAAPAAPQATVPGTSAADGSSLNTAANDMAAAPGAAEGQDQPQTVQQAPLQQSKTSVIIRRGDTLWQISRRVYGAGVRYTTIYVANEDQIADPDRILPGQIFGVPDKALPDAESEEIHRRHMQHGR